MTPNYFLFSGGEVHCKLSYHPLQNIVMNDYTMNGLMWLAQQVEIEKRLGYRDIYVTYPYFPYARQDRVMEKNEPFSLKIFTQMVNALGFAKITIWDPHSDVTPALLNNCRVIPQWDIARRVIPNEFLNDPEVMWVSPDAGAYKKLSKLITNDKNIVVGTKNRNEKGEITSTNILFQRDIAGATCFMVDDICDGGRTFIELAKVLRERGAAKVYLYVTHGIFSKGVRELQEYIDHVYTTNSFPNVATDWLTVKEIV